MSDAPLSPSDDTFFIYARALFAIDNLELICLRGHALTELAMRQLLIERLCANEKKVEDLSFARLCELSLAGLPRPFIDLILHINRIRNYVAHNVQPKELEHRLDEFFRERSHFNSRWPRNDTDAKKHLFWSIAVAAVATAIVTAHDVLKEFREGQRDLKLEALMYDEPKFFAEIGAGILEQLSMPHWITIAETEFARRSPETKSRQASKASKKRR
jgi:hypothetical protein